jgi:hypothetical protein
VVALSLFVAAIQLSVKAQSQTGSGADASLGLQRLMTDTRHAFWVGLPDDTKGQWTVPPGTANNSFTVSVNGASQDTAVEIVFPNTSSATLQTGASSMTSDPSVDRTGLAAPPTSTLWVFRSNSDGTPNAAAGAYLWMRGSERGTTVDGPLLKSLSPSAPGAVKFERPVGAETSLLPYLLRIKIVSAYYSPITGVQTSEAGDGTQVTQLSGQTALMRDHELNLDHEPGVTTSTASAGPWYSN